MHIYLKFLIDLLFLCRILTSWCFSFCFRSVLILYCNDVQLSFEFADFIVFRDPRFLTLKTPSFFPPVCMGLFVISIFFFDWNNKLFGMVRVYVPNSCCVIFLFLMLIGLIVSCKRVSLYKSDRIVRKKRDINVILQPRDETTNKILIS
jgi:hypothetical protein